MKPQLFLQIDADELFQATANAGDLESMFQGGTDAASKAATNHDFFKKLKKDFLPDGPGHVEVANLQNNQAPQPGNDPADNRLSSQAPQPGNNQAAAANNIDAAAAVIIAAGAAADPDELSGCAYFGACALTLAQDMRGWIWFLVLLGCLALIGLGAAMACGYRNSSLEHSVYLFGWGLGVVAFFLGERLEFLNNSSSTSLALASDCGRGFQIAAKCIYTFVGGFAALILGWGIAVACGKSNDGVTRGAQVISLALTMLLFIFLQVLKWMRKEREAIYISSQRIDEFKSSPSAAALSRTLFSKSPLAPLTQVRAVRGMKVSASASCTPQPGAVSGNVPNPLGSHAASSASGSGVQSIRSKSQSLGGAGPLKPVVQLGLSGQLGVPAPGSLPHSVTIVS